MTPKQEAIVRFKIDKIKKALTADKKFWHGYYHDGHGYRYLQPALYLQINDYKGALRYFNWFVKNFPEDTGYPIMLFEWTITLFKNNKLKEAEKKAFQTFMANTYLFDKFLGKEFLQFDKNESSNWEMKDMADRLTYFKGQENLADFAQWLETFVTSKKFYTAAAAFIDLQCKILHAPIGRNRTAFFNKAYKLLNNF